MELATRQHGVVSTRQLKALGYSRNSASKANKVDRLERIHRGVYAVGHRRLTWHGRCMGAVLACRPAVASHLTAAWLWDLLRFRPDSFHLTAPTERRQRRPFVMHTANLARKDVTTIEGIPATALPRTLLDLAAMLSAERLERVIERAEELRLFDLGPVDELLGRAGRHPGIGALRQVLELYRPDPAFTRSGLERLFLRLVRRAGLPAPVANHVVGGYELDMYWEPQRFAVELDVFETHGSRRSFERDRIRHEELKLIGVEMIRVTGPRLRREPEVVMERLGRFLN